ncbi:MAG: hypothetical protein A2Z20_04215 [Bdellovibrionales bacterium RBG_16_40_8]|nr:MAG: hypothetical protein A2Z20_04215 [Bdellovibrionales bacterium RBG_16_40_8]
MGSIEFKKTKKRFNGTWGPFEFNNLESGSYDAKIIWVNDIDSCTDDKMKKVQRLPSIWLGQIESAIYMQTQLKQQSIWPW